MAETRKLDPVEIRVLGALLEKEQTTPDHYPLTINAAIAACNQKTNRDPVTRLTETEVVEALDRLRDDVLTWRVEGARAERWQHSLDRRWHLTAASKAIMTLLLLRGPQTPGELRTRSARMHSFESVEEVEATLEKMADGFKPLVTELPRRPGHRETRWMHLESTEGLPEEDGEAPAAPGASAASPDVASAGPVGRRTAYDERLETLEETVESLQETVEKLQSNLKALQSELGIDQEE